MMKLEYSILLLPLLFITTGCIFAPPQDLTISHGVLDLNKWDSKKEPVIKLKGELEFYWNKLLFPHSFEEKNNSKMDGFISIPGTWQNFKIGNKKIPIDGYATYRFRVINNRSHEPLCLYVPSIYTAYRLWINDRLYVENGKVGMSRDTSRPRQYSTIVVPDEVYENFTITIQVSNFYDKITGICYAPLLGTHEAIYRQRTGMAIADSILTGIIFIIALYNLWLYLFRKQDKSPLYFSFYCLMMFFGIIIMGELYFYKFTSYFFYEFMKKLNYFFVYGGYITFVCFINHQFKAVVPRKFMKVLISIGIAYCIPVLFTPLRFYSLFLQSFQVIITLTMIFILYIVIKAIIKRNEGAVLFLIGAFIYFIFIMLDILRSNAIIDIQYLSHFGLFFFILFQSLIIALRFTRLYRTSDKLALELQDYSQQLEVKVTERTRDLETANKELSMLTEERTNLFINLAHETKTPLTLIDNYLRKEIDKRGINENLSVIKHNTDKLKHDMINYLDFEKLEKNLMVYNHELIVDLSAIVNEKCMMFKELAVKQSLQLSVDIEDDIHIKADPAALDRIINNLLDNAIKYNRPKGFITVTIKQKAPDHLSCVIENSGPGIPADSLNHIFTPYFQVTHHKRNIQGIGMGLAIIKKVIDDMHATIAVSSVENERTCFTLTFPVHILSDDDTVYHEHTGEQPLYSTHSTTLLPEEYRKDKPVLLIVEDNRQMLSYLQSGFIEEYNVYYALNGKEGLEKIAWIPVPDLIISDVMMDEMDGYEFCERIKKNKSYQDIPVIFLTAKQTRDDKIKGLNLGAVDFIMKPFSFEEIRAKVTSIIKQKKNQQEKNIRSFEKKITSMLRMEVESDYNSLYETYNLLQKERDIIELLIEGLENKEIAHRFGVSLSTIKRRIHTIYQKCGVSNKVELINLVKKN